MNNTYKIKSLDNNFILNLGIIILFVIIILIVFNNFGEVLLAQPQEDIYEYLCKDVEHAIKEYTEEDFKLEDKNGTNWQTCSHCGEEGASKYCNYCIYEAHDECHAEYINNEKKI